MNTIKVKEWNKIPEKYTGIVEFGDKTKLWLKNGKRHREDGPAYIWANGRKFWYLDGKFIWDSEYDKINLKNRIILSKDPHPLYPNIQVWKYLDKDKIRERIIIPGMEEWFIE